MNTTATLQQLQQLKLSGMTAAYRSQLELPVHQQLEAHELVAQLAQAELLTRNHERTAYFLKMAKLRQAAAPEQVECSATRNLSKQQLATLLEGQYIKSGETVLITGPTGCGKSYLACALGTPGLHAGIQSTLPEYKPADRKSDLI